MLKQFRNKPSSVHILLFFTIGLIGLVGWQVYQAKQTANLLINPDFELAEAGWQVVIVGNAQAVFKPSTDNPTNTILELNIPDNTEGCGVGVGQRLSITPLQRYKLTANFRPANPESNSAQTLLRIAQFNQAGELIKQDEILSPAPLVTEENQSAWLSLTHTLITDEQATDVELGLGFFGNQATTMELDEFAFRLCPTWLSAIRYNPVALGAFLAIIGIIGYVLGQTLWPIRRKVIVHGAVVVASLILTIIFAETVVRFVPIRLIGSNWPRGYHVPLENGQGYRLAKNYPVKIMTNPHGDQTTIMSNSLGVRDVEIPPLTDETVGVLVLGNSMTFGVVGDITESWPRRLDEQVAEIIPGADKYHFVNGGVSGYNTFQEVLLFETLIRDMERQGTKPKIALLSFFSEIWGRNLYGPKGRFTVMNDVVMYSSLQRAIVNLPGRLIEENYLDDLKLLGTSRIQNLHQLLLSKSRLYFLLSLFLTLRFEDDWDARPEVDPVAVNYEALKLFKVMAETNDILPIVVYLPKHDTFDPENSGHQELIEQLNAICQSLDLILIDPYENMKKLGINGDNAADMLTLGYDSHYSVEGNLIYAKALAPLLIEHLTQFREEKDVK